MVTNDDSDDNDASAEEILQNYHLTIAGDNNEDDDMQKDVARGCGLVVTLSSNEHLNISTWPYSVA